MGVVTDSRNKIVLQISCDGLDPALLDRLLSDPETKKVVSLSDHVAARRAPAAQDFSGAMRQVEQECYPAA